MKKYLFNILVAIVVTTILFSCKKDSDSTTKENTAAIKDKTWSGMLSYTSKPSEYYSVHFNADGTLEWAQQAGKYTGHWIMNGTGLTLTFDINTVEIKANISDDNRLVNITDNSSVFEINNGELVTNPAVPLDNTIWKGTITNTLSVTMSAYQMIFMPGNKVEVKIGNTVLGTFSYSREASGAAIRTNKGFFGVIMTGGEMKGTDTNPTFPWQALKQ